MNEATERFYASITDQREAIVRFCTSEEVEVVVEHVDAETIDKNGLAYRPRGLAAALADARRLRCPVLVSRLEVLSSDTSQISGLMAEGVPFVVTDLGGSVRPFVLQPYAGGPGHQLGAIAVRTKVRGLRLGKPASRAEASAIAAASRQRQADERARAVAFAIRQVQDAGATSLRDIAEALNARGIKAPRGGRWAAQTVASALKRLG